MLTMSFKVSKNQDQDDSILFDLVCEDVPADLVQGIEFEFSGDNLRMEPAKIALRDIFHSATNGARSQVRGTPQGPGEATAIMSISNGGCSMGSVHHSFDI